MDDNTRQILALLITSGTTIFVAWLKLKSDKKDDQ